MNETEYSVDRFEGDIAVCYDLQDDYKIEIPKYLLPPGVREGDIIVETEEGFVIRAEKTAERKRSILERFNKLKR